MKVAPSEQGFSVFTAVDTEGVTRWLVYLTCHFGGTWSAFWWSRVAAGFVVLGHVLLHSSHFLSMYVDDELSLFPAASAPLMACIEVLLACALGDPAVMEEADLGHQAKMDRVVASVLQATALFCMRECLNLRVSHLAGM